MTAKRLIIVSDGTGETAVLMTKAAMVQFGNQNVFFTRYKNVRNEAQIEAICEDAAVNGDFFTLSSHRNSEATSLPKPLKKQSPAWTYWAHF
jgi:regulator of PEP synthase PpsR (kinase-PPPase family)